MARKALFIDRDGTINRDCPYCHDLKDLYVYDDAVQIMKEYEENGYLIIIITNQSGINRGYFTENEFHLFHKITSNEASSPGYYDFLIFYTYHNRKML